MNVTSLTIEMNQWIRNSIQNCQISYSSPATSLSSLSSATDSLNNDNNDNDGWMINEPFHYMNNNHHYGDDENTLCIQSAANKAEAVLRWMRRFSIEENRPNLKPNLVTYNTVLNAHAKAGNPRAARAIVEFMQKEDGIEPDLHTYAGLIQAWSRSKKGRDGAVEAEKVFEEMLSSSKVIPNEVVLGALVDAWAKSGEMDAGEQAERVLLANDGIVASIVTFNSVMDAYAKRGKAKEAQRILKLMIATKDVTPNTRSYNILMQAWTRASNDRVPTAELLENFLLTMLTSQTNNVPEPDEVTFTIVIHAWAKSGAGLKAARSAVRLLNSMVDHKIKPNMKTWASVVDCWAKSRVKFAGHEAETILHCMNKIFEETGKKCDKPTIYIYNGVLDAWGKSGSPKAVAKVLNILSKMESGKGGSLVRPNEITYSIAIGTLAKSKEVNKSIISLDLLDRMTSTGLKPNTICFNAALNTCAYDFSRENTDTFNTAKEIFLRLRKSKDACANNISYSTMIHACKHLLPEDSSSRDAEVEKVFKVCCEDGQCDNVVLRQFQRTASTSILCKSLGNAVASKERLTISDVPSSWSSNVKLFRT